MTQIEQMAGILALLFLRYVPVIVLPAFSPLRWAPLLVRIVLALGLAWLTVMGMPETSFARNMFGAGAWISAALGEFTIGMMFGMVVMIPQAALHTSSWLIDVQAGLGASTLFDPGSQGDSHSVFGTAFMLLGTVLFFTMDLHLELYRGLVASNEVLPVGRLGVTPNVEAFFGMVGSSFLLAMMVAMPVMIGLFAIDIGAAYATRSMPQANVFFLALPLKTLAAMLLLVASLRYAPALLQRLYQDAFIRLPAILGA